MVPFRRPSALLEAQLLLQRSTVWCFFLLLAASLPGVHAQTSPTANTFSAVAGGYSGTYVAGSVCGGATSGSTYVTTDTVGDGCPGQYAKVGTSALSGMGVDGAGNVYWIDSSGQSTLHKLDAKSGIVTRVAGGGTLCAAATGSSLGALDSYGDGCPNLQTTLPSAGYVRGANIDYYGNFLVPAYSGSVVSIVCLTQSPLCPIAPGVTQTYASAQKQVGYTYRVAGCVGTLGSGGSPEAGTAYSGIDGVVASPFNNLPGDVSGTTGWGAGTVAAGTCSTSVGAVDQPRNATADKYGNVWIADTGNSRYRVVLGPLTSTFFTGNNPMYAVIQQNPKYSTAHYGYIYPIMAGFSAFTSGGITYNVPTTASSACQTGTGASTATSTDAYGDGCQWWATSTKSTSVAGLVVDPQGNPIFLDQTSQLVRVLYVQGTTMANLIKTTTGLTAQVGTVYALYGFGTAGLSTTPYLSPSPGNFSYDTKGAVDSYGNIYIGNNSPTAVYEIDAITGYMRKLFATGTNCATPADSLGIGDGCVAGSATFTSAGSSIGMAIGVDNQNNIYLADNQGYIRKVLATSLYPTAVGSSFTQNLLFHEPVNTTSITASLVNAPAGLSIVSTPACTLNNSTSDNTADCTVVVKFQPTVAGPVAATLSITNVGGSGATTLYPLTGSATAAALVVDSGTNASTSSVGTLASGATPTGLTTDGAGNLYTVDSNAGKLEQITPGGTVNILGTSPASAAQIAVDPTGNVYVASTGASSVTKYTVASGGTYTSSTISYTAAVLPQALAFDVQGNTYVADKSTGSVFEVPVDGVGPGTGTVTVATGLSNPTGLVIDGLGNIIIADQGNNAVYRVSASTGVMSTIAAAATVSNAVKIAGLVPVAIAADPGGNIYIQDGTSKLVFEVPYQTSGTATTSAVTVLTGETTPSGLAVSGAGVVSVADSGTHTVAAVARNAGTVAFGTNKGVANQVTGTLSNAGNLAITGYAEANSEFIFDSAATGATASTCGVIPATSTGTPAATPLYQGGSCSYELYFNQGTSGLPVSGTLTPITASGNGELGSLALTGTDGSGTTLNTSTTITQVGSNAGYLASGTEATFTVTVANTSGTNTDVPTGSVSVSLTGCTGGSGTYPLTSGSASVAVSGCPAGTPTIAASYGGAIDINATSTAFGSSTATPLNFTIAQVVPTLSWTPGTTSIQYSAAVGTSPLNATATSGSNAVPGVFVYTATSTTTTTSRNIHSASYLPIDTYTLGVTFYPTDSVDYATATASGGSFSVLQATTTAAIGATQTLVAADGTGNYTNVQSAVNALPSGGSIYIKPGTYSGFITVTQNNVALRGLGGDPTKVVLTHEAGAFGSTYPYTGEFQQTGITAGNGGSNGYQLPSGSTIFTGDEGSATLVVAKGTNIAVSSSQNQPTGFYAENLSLINGYNTDTITTTTTYESSSNGTCVTGQTTAMTYSALYNAGTLCGSQALAIWTTSDLSVFNNVYLASLQDTVYTASPGAGSNGQVPTRQYWFRGKITGDVDYIFGDAAAVFDSTTIYSAFHGTATGTVTIHAQNQSQATPSYLSGYVLNNAVVTSQAPGMTSLFFGRPYGNYSTWVMLNSYVDQVNPTGYTTGLGPSLTDATYLEYNDIPYTDPTPNSADINGVAYVGTGGNTGSGVTGTRENLSTNPGTPEASNNPPTSMTLPQAQAYFPTSFLSRSVSINLSSTTSWNPTAALASNVNSFVPSSSPSTVPYGQSITLLMRPQTPGLGVVPPTSYSAAAPGSAVFTVPTGTYTLTDTFNGLATVVASGSLDASGEAYFQSSTLANGTHNFTWTYSGDTNFAGSATATAYTLAVTPAPSSTSTSINVTGTPTYGQAVSVTVTVSSTGGTPTGPVALTVDGNAVTPQTLSAGTATFSLTGLSVGPHALVANYAGLNSAVAAFSASTGNGSTTVQQAPLTVAGTCFNRAFHAANSCSVTITGTYASGDSAATVFASGPTATTMATLNSPAGVYPTSAAYTLTTNGTTNYAITNTPGSFTITGAASAAQAVIFPPLPNLPAGTWQLTAHATSGLRVTYTVTGAGASISGNTLVLSGATGNTIQVTATQTDTSGDFATASATRSFTAQ